MFVSMSNGSVQDTNFKEPYEFKNPNGSYGGWYSIFIIYERKNLNVAANMALAIKYWSNKTGSTIQNIIDDNMFFNPLYLQYKDDIEKYLMLI